MTLADEDTNSILPDNANGAFTSSQVHNIHHRGEPLATRLQKFDMIPWRNDCKDEDEVCEHENSFRKEHLGQFNKEVNYVDEVEFLSLW